MLRPRAVFWIAFLCLAVAVAVGSRYYFPEDAAQRDATPAAPSRGATRATDTTLGDALTLSPRLQRTPPESGQSPRDIFETKSWYVPPPPPPPPPPVVAAPPPPPMAPPLPFQFMGWMDDGERLRAFLSQGEKVYAVGEGDPVEASYRVQRVEPNRITFLYVPLSQTQTLLLAEGSMPPPAPTAAESAATPATGGIGTAAAAAAAGVGALSPEQLDPAAVAMRIKQQQMRDRARSRASRR